MARLKVVKLFRDNVFNVIETKICQNCKQNFDIQPEDFKFYEKISVPPPTFCAECRMQRRFAWRNERSLHRRKCDKCKREIISLYDEKSPYTVYCSNCWWSDSWDGLDYGTEYDTRRNFLSQVHELSKKVPMPALHGLHSTLINSEYTNMVSYLKNCYLITHADNNENCAYGSMIDNSKDSIDNLMLFKCELTYGSVNCRSCYRTFFSVDCNDSHNIYFSRNCVGCSDCFGCVNLRNKQYHVFNRPYSKEDYIKLIEEKFPDTFQKLEKIREESLEYWAKFPQKFAHERHNANVTGDYVYTSRDTFHSFIVSDAENCKYISLITPGGIKDVYDFTNYGTTSELIYDSLQVGDQTSKVFFSWWIVTNCQNVEYSIQAVGSQDIFGSVGLKKRQYCILNKQYSKDEYFKLKARIIQDMNKNLYKDKNGNIYKYGEFFPIEMSTFPYNESFAQENFPLSKEQVLEKGYIWNDSQDRNYEVTIKAKDLPNSINDVTDQITEEIIECAHEGKCSEACWEAFRIVRQELEFLKKEKLPIPRLCPNCRHYQRLKHRNPLKLWHRQCECGGQKSKLKGQNQYQNTIKHEHGDSPCPNEFETSYAPERSEIVYCEECYLREVV
ncbi:MAG: hypothetical protein UT12_C0018G0005 [Candidatus Curtissbacteria bacterium GW2011_GWC2_38_9]|uniref:Caib/baif family protein n=1 Tax=Candidatus Curtissbacteria bacterium GW2011_GWC2_38_9 TaxID=1618414 RepID=A0A0G0PIV5_9BACT|nr:MAG: hypothetical protein UT12_C0018G0005 [Candidatus Curtissbacteria bacterium GW2011_GWC2_38_9]